MSGSRSFSPARAVPSSQSSGFHLPPISTTRFDNLVGLDATPSQPQPPARSYDATRRHVHAGRTRRAAPRGKESPHASQQRSKTRSTTPSSIQESPRSPATQQHQQQQLQPLFYRHICTVLPVNGNKAQPQQKRANKLNHSLPENRINAARSTHSYPSWGCSVTSAAFSRSSGGATPATSLHSTPSQGFALDAQRHNAATCEAQIGKETSGTTKPTKRNAEDGEKGSDHSGAACAATTMAKPQSRKAEDEPMQQLLRTFLAQRKGTNSTRRKSLPLTAFTRPRNRSITTATTTTARSTNETLLPPDAQNEKELDAYRGLSPDELQELFIVLRDLRTFLPAEETQPMAAVTERPLAPSLPTTQTNDNGFMGARRGMSELGSQLSASATSNGSSTATTNTAQSPNANHVVRFTDVPDGEERYVKSRKQSTEGRYKEALKTIESAAGDCQVALQRVQEYSESLYVLVQTWMHLHDNRFDEFARAVLQRLLDNNPSYRVLFYNVNVDRQSLVILDMIGRAVVAFTRPADLMDIMGEMGARHNLYGLAESHFISMRDAFLQVYAEFVSPDTYNESVGVWRMFWKTTIELAVSGGSSERGIIYTQRRNVVWAERVTSACKLLIPRQRSGGFHRLMQATYKRAVARHPELDVFQQMAELRTAHRCMEALLRIVKSVTEGGVPAVIEYNDQLSIQALFTDCGAELDAEVMVKMEEPFLEACEFYLAPTASWNIVVRAALQELWSVYIAGYWTAQPATGDGDESGGTAPDGKKPFCLMFTDIEASTRLWDCDTQTMGTAVREHHKLIRGLIEDFGGYEVKTVGDSFLIATNDVTQALLIAFGIQLELMAGPSAPNFRMVDSPQGTGAASCWREDALRVRVGIHYCTDATAVYDSVHNRFDYYGPSVNCAARVEAAACGGQVLLSHGAYEQLKAEDAYAKNPLSSLFAQQLGKLVQAQEARGISVDDARLSWFSALVLKAQMGIESAQEDAKRSVEAVTTMSALTHVEDEGLHPLKGIAEPVQLYSLLPVGLHGRVFQKENSLRTVASRGDLFASSQFKDLSVAPSTTTSGLLNSDELTSPLLMQDSAASDDLLATCTPRKNTFKTQNAG